MKNSSLLAAALMGAVALTSPSQAQVKIKIIQKNIQAQPIQPGGIIGIARQANPLALVENKDVQKDMKITDAQIKQIGELGNKYKEDTKALTPRDFKKRQEIAAQTKQALVKILTKEQGVRLEQLEIQRKGVAAFFDPNVVKTLEISDEKRKEIIKTNQGIARKRIETFKEAKGNQEEIQKKLGELNREAVKEIVKNLSPEQQTKWKNLAGEQFQGVFPVATPIRLIQPKVLPIRIQTAPKKIE